MFRFCLQRADYLVEGQHVFVMKLLLWSLGKDVSPSYLFLKSTHFPQNFCSISLLCSMGKLFDVSQTFPKITLPPLSKCKESSTISSLRLTAQVYVSIDLEKVFHKIWHVGLEKLLSLNLLLSIKRLIKYYFQDRT